MVDVNVDPKPAASGGFKKSVPWLIVAALMAVEGVGIFFAVRFFMPDPAAAVASGEEGGGDSTTGSGAGLDLAEVELVECRPVNKESGKLVTFQIRVSALVAAGDLKRARTLVQANRTRIKDRVNVVIRSAAPKHLNEPGLETVKRRIKYELDRIFHDEKLILEVLIPEFMQSGPGV